jgi:hypothetical protein
MPDDLASTNVNRSFSLSATSIAIFTFTLVFLYPRFASGEIDGLIFQAALVVMGVSTFCLAIASVHYYGSSLVGQIDDASRRGYQRRGDTFWGAGYYLLFLSPSLVLLTVGLWVVGGVWFCLWALLMIWGIRNFPRLRTNFDRPDQRA